MGKYRKVGEAHLKGVTNPALRVGALVRSTWNPSGAVWTVEEIIGDDGKDYYGPILHVRSVNSGRHDSKRAINFDIVELSTDD